MAKSTRESVFKLVIVLFALFITYFLFVTVKKKQKILERHQLVCAKITNIIDGRGASNLIDYTYSYDGKLFNMYKRFCSNDTRQRYNEGETGILVVVEIGNAANNELIEDAKDLKKYNIDLQDPAINKCAFNYINKKPD